MEEMVMDGETVAYHSPGEVATQPTRRRSEKDTRTSLLTSYAISSKRTKDVWEKIRARDSVPKYPTGLKSLDRITWGLHREELMVIGARPKQGKTSLAVQLAVTVARKELVLYYSLEMSRDQLIERVLSSMMRIDNQRLRGGDDSLSSHDREIPEIAKEMSEMKLCVIDNAGRVPEEIHEHVDAMKPAFVFLDYIQLMKGREFKKTHETIADYIQYFKSLQKEYDCGFVIMSQHNRMGLLKASGALEEAPDTVIDLEWIGQSKEDEKEKNDYLIVVKYQRNGPAGTCLCKYLPEYFLFRNP